MTSFAYADDPAPVFEFKSTTTKLTAFVPSSLEPEKLILALQEQLGDGEHFLSNEQIAIDFSLLKSIPSALEIAALVNVLRQFQLKPIAAQGGSIDQQVAAQEAGLVVLQDSGITPAAAPIVETIAAPSAMIIDRPVRTGQQVYAKGGDLIVLALVSHGAEVIADGNIHVYAPLRGRALAGARGNTEARIFTTCMEAELVSIAGVYRSLDANLPDSIAGKPSQIFLDQDKLVIEALSQTN
ncbi:septum site-determining protein MinC [Deefgea piscis]|uniref:Probable septum site-determining protein MinC n=1 Tax=Deefgea piscis TaxID=2739061 RepID=A0A6M8SUV7_9NEIS|nr:septum site-determining protein MinC [Deefgea piscis]QKJ67336.1 septum site-determining protein MinC [Deefgea piscis]